MFEGTKKEWSFIYLLDTSASMYGAKINQLNVAMSEVLQIAEEFADKREVALNTRIIEFNSTARWIFGNTQHGVKHIEWKSLNAGGATDTASAIDLAQRAVRKECFGTKSRCPIIVILITDGSSNEPQDTFLAIERLSCEETIRIAIGIGDDVNQEELEAFASVGDFEYRGIIQYDTPYVFNIDSVFALKEILQFVFLLIMPSPVHDFDEADIELLVEDDIDDDSEWED